MQFISMDDLLKNYRTKEISGAILLPDPIITQLHHGQFYKLGQDNSLVWYCSPLHEN